MSRPETLEERLAKLTVLEEAPPSAEAETELRKALGAPQNALCAKAARLVAKHGLDDLMPDLVAAFDRFMSRPTKSDKGCLAKNAVVDALNELGSDDVDVFLRGVRHVQREPVFGGQEDTAGYLRGACGFALARMGYPDALFELATLLMDAEVQPRRAAAKTLAYLGGRECELLLRMKVLAGDREPDGYGECFSGLMSVAPERSLDFVARYLDDEDAAIAEGAAIAIGESRSSEAFACLRECWDTCIQHEPKKRLLLPIALTRCDEAIDFLLGVLRDEHRDYAVAAVEALRIFTDSALCEQIREAVAERGERAVSEAYVAAFDDRQ